MSQHRLTYQIHVPDHKIKKNNILYVLPQRFNQTLFG